jgi:hypothetical protein
VKVTLPLPATAGEAAAQKAVEANTHARMRRFR